MMNRLSWAEKLELLASSLPADQASVLRGLLAENAEETPSSGKAWRGSAPQQEHAVTAPQPHDDPNAIRTVGVIGGGTAGYLTALALRAKLPWLDVTLVESSDIPVIGVGEASTPPLTAFLHHYLGIDPLDFLEKVQPMWKLGIKFDWGSYPDGIMAPFDWGANSVGVLGSMADRGDPNAFTVQSLFMLADRVPVFRLPGGEHLSMMDSLPFAYHLENRRLVRYLTGIAAERGIRHVDAQVADVELSGPDWVKTLHTKEGGQLEFDLYMDCTGFRSLLLGQALGTDFVGYEDSLFTDTAVTGYIGETDAILPYTTATTMDRGWTWRIPTPGEDHVGYVHSSRFCSTDEAADELAKLYPDVGNLKTVRFRPGRREEMWRGNVIALGNAHGFVEPLESSSLLMLIFSIMSLIPMFPRSWKHPNGKAVLNDLSAKRWDGLRWFLSIHYKFNERGDSEFWREVHANADISGIQPLLDVYAGGAPLRLRDPLTRRFVRSVSPTFYELDGVDCLLMGQNYPAERLVSTESLDVWRARKAAADVLVGNALTQRQAQAAFHAEPELTESLMYGENSWVTRYGAEGWLQSSRA